MTAAVHAGAKKTAETRQQRYGVMLFILCAHPIEEMLKMLMGHRFCVAL